MPTTQQPDYGIDAPGVVRNLALASVGLFAIAAAARLFGWLPRVVTLGPVSLDVVGSVVPMAFGFASGAVLMYFGSKYGKIEERNKLLAPVAWKGSEQVLDVGCGRGLVLVGAALKLTTGCATGIDIWQTEDVSGNSATAPLENAKLEGVADKVRVETSDMRKMPFADGAFDVILSRAAIHNIYNARERADAIREIARVLKPGGRAVIADIRHISEYMAVFAANGCTARRVNARLGEWALGVVTFGRMRPNTLIIDKPR